MLQLIWFELKPVIIYAFQAKLVHDIYIFYLNKLLNGKLLGQVQGAA